MSEAIESRIAAHMMTIHKAMPAATSWQTMKSGNRICSFKGSACCDRWLVIYNPRDLHHFCIYVHRGNLCQIL